jgi:drug/metabolite transporter (DMT)-like permease
MNYTLIAIISAFFAAIANILARVLLKKFKSSEMLGVNFLIMAATLLVISPFFYKFTMTFQNIGLVILISLIDTLGNYFYFKTFEKTEASVATPMLSLAPGFTFLFGWLFLGDIVSLQTYMLAAALIVLLVLFSTDFKNLKQFRSSTLLPALASSFLFGISAIPSKVLLNSNVTNAPTLYMFRAMIIAALAFLIFKKSAFKLLLKDYWFIFFRGLFVIAQWVLLYFALSRGNAGVSVTLGNITPIFVFILSMLFLHEKPTWKKAITCTMILAISIII